MSDRHYFIGLCIEFIKFYLDYVLMYMFMSAMYCVCMHTFHSAYICMVFNSVKCVHNYHNQVIFLIITYLSHCLNLQPILGIVH